MDRMLYIAMTGAKQTMLAQAVNTNNLANVSTTAFKADFAAARSMPVFGPGYPTRAYAMTERPGTDFAAGPINHTGRELDVAVKGQGWIAVQAADGSEAYTRAGHLQLTANGQLLTAAGQPVLGDGGPIALPPSQKIEIGDDGTISVLPQGQTPNTIAAVERIRLVNPPADQLVKGNDGLMRLKDGTTAPPDASVQLSVGALEASNVNAVEAMVNLIDLSRQFEMQVKMMETAKQNDQQTARLVRLA